METINEIGNEAGPGDGKLDNIRTKVHSKPFGINIIRFLNIRGGMGLKILGGNLLANSDIHSEDGDADFLCLLFVLIVFGVGHGLIMLKQWARIAATIGYIINLTLELLGLP
jgi:hypothetical protein